ncbi:hypothetical protein NIES4071_05560 [Calothrix sp. NIES-4071]|nr:hypothetical protein NIES4071_05560 [Calothrix sp. NIES-4071]BAZ54901.1 hypothetical protein NIES4105_05550 [Calothrix sp. NIES-4105]
MADDIEKRLNYFTGQFLTQNDFNDEQKYFLDRLDRHHRFLHSPGVADGLEVKGIINDPKVTVEKGTAIDGDGKQIVLANERSVALDTPELLEKLKENTNILLVVISYYEQGDDKDPAGTNNFTRIKESPSTQPFLEKEDPSKVKYIRLARLKVSPEGKLLEPPQDISEKAGQAPISENSVGENKLDLAVQEKLVTRGDKHDHSNNDGAKIKHSNLTLDDKTNPHGTTAADVKALPLAGGDINGRVTIKANTPGVYNPPNNESVRDKGSMYIINTFLGDCYGLVSTVAETGDIPPRGKKPIPAAAMVAIAARQNVYGIYTTALSDNFALFVEGKATISGTLVPAHIGETFINGSGQRLRKGDVVKLKGSPISRFRGAENNIPIVEVTLADKENDTSVIGIVDCEAIPEPGRPDTRVEPENSSFIENGGELYIVTLGVFTHCKVDAKEASIEVGDLLTTSQNPGHAKKAIEPKIGTIIGKALQPLREGTGEIAVFVNLQ